MTCIVGMVDDDKTIWIGGDAAAVGGYSVAAYANTKVWRAGEFLFGFTGSFRLGQVLQYGFLPPARRFDQDTYAYMVTDFVAAVRETCKEHGCLITSAEGLDGFDGSAVMVGYDKHLFVIYDDLQVQESSRGYDALGTGEEYALGSVFSSEHLDTQERITLALEAAANFSKGVQPPFTIERLEPHDVVTQR